MLRVVEGASVLFLLAVFLAYVIAPGVDAISRRVRRGRRRRPLSRPAAILLLYGVLLGATAMAWRGAAPIVRQWVRVTAPTVLDSVFADDNREAAVDRLYRRLPLPAHMKPAAARTTNGVLAYVEEQVRAALNDVVGAARYGRWVVVPPVVAFLLLAYAPGFRRSAVRALPHGHLRWRGEEYFRDVNSALAGYVRAQLASSVFVGAVCTVLFALLHVPYPVSMGIVAGVLELVPVIGPLIVVLMAAGQAGQHALGIVIVLVALRLVQDLVVYPRLIRKGMHLPPAVVILVVWCGATLNGAAGVILAIPVAGLLFVSLRHWREYHQIERLVRAAVEK